MLKERENSSDYGRESSQSKLNHIVSGENNGSPDSKIGSFEKGNKNFEQQDRDFDGSHSKPLKIGPSGSQELTFSYLCDNSKLGFLDKEIPGRNSVEKVSDKGKEIVPEDQNLENGRWVERDFLQLNEIRGTSSKREIENDEIGGEIREKKPKLETLNLSLALSDASLSLDASNPLQNVDPGLVSFEEGYSQLFGGSNLMILRDGKSAHLSLDERTGSGFISHDLYSHGFFSASIKLPADYTAGVVVAFYMSNVDIFEKNHDEIDFEFLGNIRGKEWRVQTNVYGNGSTRAGREERYGLWFDPSENFHQYSILWSEDKIIFYIDNVPIREVKRTETMGGDFPSKPMSLYGTIWDASMWATNGGKYKVNYRYSPYIAEFSDFVLHGCAVDPIEMSSTCEIPSKFKYVSTPIDSESRIKMQNFRKKQLQYSYCYDKTRYKVPPSECIISPHESQRLRRFDPVTFGGSHHRHGKQHHNNQVNRDGMNSV